MPDDSMSALDCVLLGNAQRQSGIWNYVVSEAAYPFSGTPLSWAFSKSKQGSGGEPDRSEALNGLISVTSSAYTNIDIIAYKGKAIENHWLSL